MMNGQETCWERQPDWLAPVAALPGSKSRSWPRQALSRAAAIWRVALERLSEWRLHAGQRDQLARFSDRMLKDIGVTRADAHRETRKWFWQV